MSLYEKLLKLQQTVGAIKKDSVNPYFNSKYFDINKLLEQLAPEANKLGLVIQQPLEYNPTANRSIVTTRIVEADTGTAVESSIALPENADPQKMGSAITYYRRYSLQSLLALGGEDDDGNLASKTIQKRTPATSAKIAPQTGDTAANPQQSRPVTGADVAEDNLSSQKIQGVCKECGAEMVHKSGISQAGKEWSGLFCPENNTHKPVWL